MNPLLFVLATTLIAVPVSIVLVSVLMVMSEKENWNRRESGEFVMVLSVLIVSITCGVKILISH